MNESQDDAARRLQDQAEAVRAYLVSVRGGAPLLSSTDARLLHGWLVRGVRIGAIVRGIDRAAERRLARKVRAPLSLASCRAEVENQQKHGGAWVRSARPLPGRGAPAADPRFAAVERLAAATTAAIAALPAAEADGFLTAACALAARFLEEAWELAPRDVLLEGAEARLEGARALFDDEAWAEALEATARDELRQRYPRLTATWIAQEAHGGLD